MKLTKLLNPKNWGSTSDDDTPQSMEPMSLSDSIRENNRKMEEYTEIVKESQYALYRGMNQPHIIDYSSKVSSDSSTNQYQVASDFYSKISQNMNMSAMFSQQKKTLLEKKQFNIIDRKFIPFIKSYPANIIIQKGYTNKELLEMFQTIMARGTYTNDESKILNNVRMLYLLETQMS